MSAKIFIAFCCCFLFVLLAQIPPSANISAQVRSEPVTFFGRVREAAPPICMMSQFQLVDCNNTSIASLQSTAANLNMSGFLDQTVVITGFLNGGDCPVVSVQEIRPVPDTCGAGPRVNENVSFEGVLQVAGPSICMQGGFELRDCQNNILVHLGETDNGPDLDSLVGQYIRISGQDVGVECVVVAVSTVTTLPNVCVTPQPQQPGGPREGVLQRNASGGFELRDCQNNVKLAINTVANSPDLSGFIGQYVRLKGKMRHGSITVRAIIVKTSRCGQ